MRRVGKLSEGKTGAQKNLVEGRGQGGEIEINKRIKTTSRTVREKNNIVVVREKGKTEKKERKVT